MTALGDDATVPKILITLYVIRVGKGLNAYSSAACALTYLSTRAMRGSV